MSLSSPPCKNQSSGTNGPNELEQCACTHKSPANAHTDTHAHRSIKINTEKMDSL